MADSPDALVKKEELPERDPIVSRSTSGVMLICALLLIGVLAWALYDETYGQRPWKRAQQEFVARYTRYLDSIKGQAGKTEKEVMESPDYQEIEEQLKEAKAASDPAKAENNRQIKIIEDKLAAITDPFQNQRGQITVANYRIETAPESKKASLRQKVEQMKAEQVNVDMPADDGSGKTTRVKMNYTQLADLYSKLKDDKAALLAKNADLSKDATELEKKRTEYLKDHMTGLAPAQIESLKKKYQTLDYSIKQINVSSANIVDRCETCHLGVREPLTLKASDLAPDGPGKKPDEWARAFVSHPSKELLTIHNPDKFGCSACHGGNGRATTSIEKGHGLNKFWLHPLYEKENMQAGCQQCHTQDRVLDGAPALNLGKDLFQQRGCVGCHRSEGFDRETDALASTRQMILQLEENIKANQREAQAARDSIKEDTSEEEATKLRSRAEALTVTNSLIAAQVDQLNVQARYLMQDQKKVGPNLKDVRLKLVKEWIPEWLKDPQAFRPGTKMPTFWRLNGEMAHDSRADDDRKAIAAYLWQEGSQGSMPSQDFAKGDIKKGQELFTTVGCMACHSIGEGDSRTGGTFAANLQKVGEKANFDYIVRWIYNPRQRWAPYCPKHKRDLTPKDYAEKGLPFVFDTEQHSKCPIDGAELQVQNMTVMPNFRLSVDEARDIASFLFSLSGAPGQKPSYPDASYMDDPALHDKGKALIKQYGCAGCHEIRGFEDEQRIGKELTAEGSTPIERLDFALLTKNAEDGVDPETGKEGKEWYNHKGFFEHKLKTPWIYDKGKEKEPQDRLRMPKPYISTGENGKDRTELEALTTFLLGSVGTEGANVPPSIFYRPDDRRKAIQDGWWVIKKYNCMGCHSIQVGQDSVLSTLPQYLNEPDPSNLNDPTRLGKEQLPPKLTSEGARVNPNWLLKFLHDPSLSSQAEAKTAGAAQPGGSAEGGKAAPAPQATQAQPGAVQPPSESPPSSVGEQPSAQPGEQLTSDQIRLVQFHPQTGEDQKGVRLYLRARMPTFNFSPNELQILVRFFMAVSSQEDPYIPEPIEPLIKNNQMDEKELAFSLFTSSTAPCLKCHITDNKNIEGKSAPNFLLAADRLKPQWTYRWLLDPQQISPGTAMPSGLFKKEGDRMVFNGGVPDAFQNYKGDHAQLLVRYLFLLTPAEQQHLMSSSPKQGTSAQPAATTPKQQPPSTAHARRARAAPLKSHAALKTYKGGRAPLRPARPPGARGLTK